MQVTREQRDAWAAGTRDSPFNNWLSSRISAPDGSLDLDLLHEVAAEFGVDASRYAHLNPGQRRMNVGNRLRKLVPHHVYTSAGGEVALAAKIDRPKPVVQAVARAVIPAEWSFLGEAKVLDLLRLQALAVDELRARGVVRTANAPQGDYAESLFAKAFGWTLAPNSEKSFDASGDDGMRYQIKSRRLRTYSAGERQLSAIRNLPEARFEKLAAVLFDGDFQVNKAALIPHAVVMSRAMHIPHVNGWRFILDDSVWQLDGVEDVTAILRSVSLDADMTDAVGEG